ncbi:hypothetical protein Q3G72_017796 [Acer saccharum]|nr:hypothetical protein Q3G72_017796 [Acer saccharum]
MGGGDEADGEEDADEDGEEGAAERDERELLLGAVHLDRPAEGAGDDHEGVENVLDGVGVPVLFGSGGCEGVDDRGGEGLSAPRGGEGVDRCAAGGGQGEDCGVEVDRGGVGVLAIPCRERPVEGPFGDFEAGAGDGDGVVDDCPPRGHGGGGHDGASEQVERDGGGAVVTLTDGQERVADAVAGGGGVPVAGRGVLLAAGHGVGLDVAEGSGGTVAVDVVVTGGVDEAESTGVVVGDEHAGTLEVTAVAGSGAPPAEDVVTGGDVGGLGVGGGGDRDGGDGCEGEGGEDGDGGEARHGVDDGGVAVPAGGLTAGVSERVGEPRGVVDEGVVHGGVGDRDGHGGDLSGGAPASQSCGDRNRDDDGGGVGDLGIDGGQERGQLRRGQRAGGLEQVRETVGQGVYGDGGHGVSRAGGEGVSHGGRGDGRVGGVGRGGTGAGVRRGRLGEEAAERVSVGGRVRTAGPDDERDARLAERRIRVSDRVGDRPDRLFAGSGVEPYEGVSEPDSLRGGAGAVGADDGEVGRNRHGEDSLRGEG